MGFDEGRDEELRVVKLERVAQIEFAEWMLDGHRRHLKFIGLREDKDAGGGRPGRLGVSYDSKALPGLAVGQ